MKDRKRNPVIERGHWRSVPGRESYLTLTFSLYFFVSSSLLQEFKKRDLAIHFCSHEVMPKHMRPRVYGVQHQKPWARIFLLSQVVCDGCFVIMLRQLSISLPQIILSSFLISHSLKICCSSSSLHKTRKQNLISFWSISLKFLVSLHLCMPVHLSYSPFYSFSTSTLTSPFLFLSPLYLTCNTFWEANPTPSWDHPPF